MLQYNRGDPDVALRIPVPYVQSRPSTSSTMSFPPNTANVSAGSSGTDQSALFAYLPEPPCASLEFNWPRVLITDPNFPQSSEHSNELTEIEHRSGETSRCLPNTYSNKSKVKKEQKFACIYCERAFSQRHDFKRHFKDSHESDVVYVCDYYNCSKEFFLADKFTIHHQKSHCCGERCRHAEECRRANSEQRARRGCGACLYYSFTLDDWLDHVANHYNNGFKKKDWNEALVFSSLLSQPEIVEAWGKLTSDPFPLAGWSTDHQDRLQSNMERNIMTPVELAQDIFTTYFGHTKSNTTQPFGHVQPAEDVLQFAPSTLNTGIPSLTPRSHSSLSSLNGQSITMTLPQISYSANQASDMPQYAEDDVAFRKPSSQYPGYTNVEYITQALGHSYAKTACEPHQAEAVTEQQNHSLPFSYPGRKSVVTNPSHFLLYSNNTTPHSIIYPYGPPTEKASII